MGPEPSEATEGCVHLAHRATEHSLGGSHPLYVRGRSAPRARGWRNDARLRGGVGCRFGRVFPTAAARRIPGRAPELRDGRLIVFLGRIAPKKGFEFLVPAVARLASSMPDVRLVLAGPDFDGYASTVQDLVRRYQLDDRVTWTGLITGPEKLALLRDADAWVLPSRDENFAIAAVEAMAAGAPVIITDRVGIQDVVRLHDAGLVVEPTAAAIADALQVILSDDLLRRRISTNGRRLAFSEFSWDVAAARLTREYRAIVSDGFHSAQRREVSRQPIL